MRTTFVANATPSFLPKKHQGQWVCQTYHIEGDVQVLPYESLPNDVVFDFNDRFTQEDGEKIIEFWKENYCGIVLFPILRYAVTADRGHHCDFELEHQLVARLEDATRCPTFRTMFG